MRKLAPATILAAAVLAFTACSSDGEPTTESALTGPLATQTSAAVPTLNPQAPIQKKVGEEAAWGCNADRLDDCAVEFTITSITGIDRDSCSEYVLDDVGADDRLVRVEIDVDSRGEYPGWGPSRPAADIIGTDNWSGVDDEDYTSRVDALGAGCGDLEPDLFYKPVPIGRKGRGSIVFAVPPESTRLALRGFDQSTGWEWQLPK